MARKIIWIVGYIAALPIVIILSIVWGLSVFTRTFRTAAAQGLAVVPVPPAGLPTNRPNLPPCSVRTTLLQ